jgi:hypothetical protein
MAKKSKDQYSDKEAAARLVAALKGARIAESKPMKRISPKRKTNLGKVATKQSKD